MSTETTTDTKTPPTLLPCPFCGGDARHDRHASGNPVVICYSQACGAMIMGITPKDAEKLWNQRAASADLLTANTALEMANTPFEDADERIQVFKQETWYCYRLVNNGETGPFQTWREAYRSAESHLFQIELHHANSALREAEGKCAEMRAIVEHVFANEHGREFYPSNLDGSPNELFERTKKLLASTTLGVGWRSPEEVEELERKHDELVERSVGAMAIAEGDEGHEAIPRDCPMLVAVSELRQAHDQMKREIAETMETISRLNADKNAKNSDLSREASIMRAALGITNDEKIPDQNPTHGSILVDRGSQRKRISPIDDQLKEAWEKCDELSREVAELKETKERLWKDGNTFADERDSALAKCEAMRERVRISNAESRFINAEWLLEDGHNDAYRALMSIRGMAEQALSSTPPAPTVPLTVSTQHDAPSIEDCLGFYKTGAKVGSSGFYGSTAWELHQEGIAAVRNAILQRPLDKIETVPLSVVQKAAEALTQIKQVATADYEQCRSGKRTLNAVSDLLASLQPFLNPNPPDED